MSGNFKRAITLYRRGRYNDVIRLLEPQVFRFRGSEEFYYILGMACLRCRELEASHTYLSRCVDLSEDSNINSLLGLAAIHLYRQEATDAIRCWLRVLDLSEGNLQATRGLEFIRSESYPEKVLGLTTGKGLDRLLPQDEARPGLGVVWGVLAVVIVLLLGTGVLLILTRLQPGATGREGFVKVDTANLDSLSLDSGGSQYSLSDIEIQKAVRLINELFLGYEDNTAQREINRILRSNAHPDLKTQVMLLAKNIAPPTFAKFNGEFTYRDVISDVYLYDQCYILWRGRAANLVIGDEHITFDLLVGYVGEEVLEGIVPVTLYFAVDLPIDYPVEVLGKVVAVNPSEFYLEGISIRRLLDR